MGNSQEPTTAATNETDPNGALSQTTYHFRSHRLVTVFDYHFRYVLHFGDTIERENMKVKIVPIKVGNYYEQCSVYFDDYPVAYVHIDTFFKRDEPQLYNDLNTGKTVTTEWTINKWDAKE